MSTDISFATFNLFNFQEVGKSVYTSAPVTVQNYLPKLFWTQQKLNEINADVIAFQELWSKGCLLQAFEAAEFQDYELVFIDDDWYNTAVALAVRKPWRVVDKTVIKEFPFNQLVRVDDEAQEDDDVRVEISKFSRSILKVNIRPEGGGDKETISVFACHLKSKLKTHVSGLPEHFNTPVGLALSTIRRTAEAAALRIILSRHMQGENTPVVVLGDLNDDPYSNTLAILTEQPTMTRFSRGTDKGLYSTLFLQQLQSYRDVYYTHQFQNHKGVIDHILVSEEFCDFSSDGHWQHVDTRIWNDYIDDEQAFTSDHGIMRSAFR